MRAEHSIAIVGESATLAAEALTWAFTHSGASVAGVYPCIDELTAALRIGRPRLHAAIVDVDGNAAPTSAISELRRGYPQLRILLLCSTASRAVVRCAIDAHADGFVLKSESAEDITVALRHVLSGRVVMPAGWQHTSPRPAPGAPLAALSMREREVMELLAGGLSNEEIASHLVVSPNTVKFHLRTIYSRLGVRNRVQAVQTVSRRPGIHPSQSTMADGRSSRLARPHTR